MYLKRLSWRAIRVRRWLARISVLTAAVCGSHCMAASSPLTASQYHWITQASQGACAAGQNEYGELGDGTAVTRSTPVPVVSSSNFTRESTGFYHSLAVASDGTVWAWGYNGNGELGDGTTSDSPTPIPVPGLSGMVAVAAGQYHSLALKNDGTVWAWGYNAEGQLGNGTNTQSFTPVPVIELSNVVAIAAGALHSVALRSDGTVWTWGYNADGELGNGTTTASTSAVQVTALSGVKTIASGAYHNLALKTDGTVWTWGYNGNGELGDGSTTSRPNIVRASGLASVISIDGGVYHSVAVESNGSVWAWGGNTAGQLGNGGLTGELTPTEVPSFTGGTAAAAGAYFTVALKSNGTIWAWGDNSYGQLANGSTTASVVPVEATACPSGSYPATRHASMSARIAASQYFSLAVEDNGTVVGFGQNTYGQLGDGTTINRSSPVQAAGISGAVGVAAGWYHGLAVENNGTVWAWGNNNNGQLGTGNTSSSPTPLQVSTITGVMAVSAGQYHSLALKSNGTVWAWGYNGYGELGDGSTTQRLVPVQTIGLTDIVAIAAGEFHSLALKSDGTVWAWGNNGNGELGNGTTTNQTSAVQVALLNDAISIAAGAAHSLALRSDGTVWDWGYNGNGQLGDGSTTSRLNIVRASGLTGVSEINGSDNDSYAVKSDGTAWAWGYNAEGELGDGSVTSSNVPVQVTGLTHALVIASGTQHSLALNSNGTISAWGTNNYGEFGEASPTSSTVPTTTPVSGVGPFYELTLTAAPADGGTITASPAKSDGYYQSGTQVCLSAVPAEGFAFNGFSGTPLNGSYCLTITANASVTANFVTSLNALRFIPITPCRIADTRNANGPFGGPALVAGSTREFAVPSSACNIPADAQAYSLNVTVVPATTLQYLTVWPAGESQPLVSTLNSFDGRVKANAAIVPAGTSGGVDVYATDTTNVILDIDGYFVPKSNTAALGFYAVKPCRIVDTRSGSGPLAGPSLTAGEERTFPVLASACGLPSIAKGYSLNFTAVPKKTLGYLTVWPSGESKPNVSTLNAPTGAITANAALVPAGTSGSVDVYASDATDVLIDVNGYFATPGTGALSLYKLAPCRVLDSRNPPGSKPFSGTKTVNVTASSCSVPASAQDLVFNATVVPPGPLEYLTLWATGQSQPVVSTLNAVDGSVTSNLAIVPSGSGSVNAFASNPTQLILDISGYFAP